MAKKAKRPFKTDSANQFYEKVIQDYELEDHHRELLRQAACCLDRIEQARAQIDKDGLYLPDRYGGTKPHPAAKDERDHRLLFSKLLRELNLDSDSVSETRPPRINY